mmetsp:Transcript_33961/g.44811  ORF Transcript_33961/g.44811 Transcript_33961/m.44811 type:complete len:373 (-) Transcript_33961:238-1356(-)
MGSTWLRTTIFLLAFRNFYLFAMLVTLIRSDSNFSLIRRFLKSPNAFVLPLSSHDTNPFIFSKTYESNILGKIHHKSILNPNSKVSFQSWTRSSSNTNILEGIWNGLVIESAQNQHIKLIRKLQRNKRERERCGQLVLEGFKLVKDSIGAGFDPELILISEEFLIGKHGKAISEMLKENEQVPFYVAKDKLIKESCETKNPQGILAVLKKPTLKIPEKPSLLIICDNINDPGNLGTIVRTAASVPADGVVLLGSCCDVWSSKALRASMGTVFRIPIAHFESLNDLENYLADHPFKIYAATGDVESEYFDVDWKQSVGLVIGSEANGLGSPIRERMAAGEVEGVKIPLANGVESLNAGVAGSIILGEIIRQRR